MTRARDNSFNPFNNQMAGKNMVINGAFDYWQRGTSFTTGAFQYSADRWRIGRGAFQTGGTYTRQNANLEGFRYCIRVQRDSGGNGTGGGYLATSFETSESLRFSGKIVTLSFYARKSASYTGGSLSVVLQNATGTDETGFAESNFATGANNIFNSSVTGLTTSWQRFSLTGLVPANSTQLGIRIIVEYAGVAPSDDYAEITGVQLELGSSATSFSRAAGTIGGELALCQRYYAVGGGDLSFSGVTTAGNGYYGMYYFPVDMRIPPSVTFTNANNAGPFGATPGGAGGTTTRYTREGRSASTSSSGYFGSSYAASAEL